MRPHYDDSGWLFRARMVALAVVFLATFYITVPMYLIWQAFTKGKETS